MNIFVTSSPYLDGADRAILNPENHFVENLREVLPPFPRVLFVASDPERHDLTCSFGMDTGGRMMGGMPAIRPEVGRYIFYMPYPDRGAAHWFGELDKQYYTDTWEQTLELLRQRHGPGTRVAVLSDATLAYFREA